MMKDGKKALFLDLDGTLLDDEKKISAENREAIHMILEKGHSVIITTGRPLSSALKQAERLGLIGPGCFIIAYNGGVLYDTCRGEEIFRSSLPLSHVRKTFREAERRGLHIQTYSGNKVLVEPRCDDEEIRAYCAKTLMEYEVVPDIDMLEDEPVKMLAIDLKDPAPLQGFREWIAEWAGDDMDTFFSCAEYIEIVRKDLNKGNALKQMAQLIGVPVENTISAGDEANDIDMIRVAGTGCAMLNATDEVKAHADYITVNDNNHSGVAEIIDRFVL